AVLPCAANGEGPTVRAVLPALDNAAPVLSARLLASIAERLIDAASPGDDIALVIDAIRPLADHRQFAGWAFGTALAILAVDAVAAILRSRDSRDLLGNQFLDHRQNVINGDRLPIGASRTFGTALARFTFRAGIAVLRHGDRGNGLVDRFSYH